MQRPAFRIRSDMRVGVTWALFIERALTMAAVVDERGRPVGTLWRGDLAAAVLDDEPTQPGAGAGEREDRSWPFRRMPQVSELSLVGDVMRVGVATIPGDASLEQARTLLRDSGAAELVVVDRAGGMLGILAARDLLAGHDGRATLAALSVAQMSAAAGRRHVPRR